MVNKNEPYYIQESNKHILFKQSNTENSTTFIFILLSTKMHYAQNLNADSFWIMDVSIFFRWTMYDVNIGTIRTAS
jgi:hypothetical protein